MNVMDHWQGFFLAQVGASAALAGLIFVAVSISLPRIVAAPQLSNRAFQALAVLFQILVVSSLMLVPQTLMAIGVEVLAIGAAMWVTVATLDVRTLRAAAAEYRGRIIARIVLSQIAALLYVGAGIAILAAPEWGVYVLVPAVICAYLIALLDAWVLLIEIHR